MAIPEPDRIHMYNVAKDDWGDRAADALMAHLPPLGWGDVATKQDLALMGELTNQRFGQIEHRLERLESHIISQGRTFLLGNFLSVLTIGGMFFAFGR